MGIAGVIAGAELDRSDVVQLELLEDLLQRQLAEERSEDADAHHMRLTAGGRCWQGAILL